MNSGNEKVGIGMKKLENFFLFDTEQDLHFVESCVFSMIP